MHTPGASNRANLGMSYHLSFAKKAVNLKS